MVGKSSGVSEDEVCVPAPSFRTKRENRREIIWKEFISTSCQLKRSIKDVR